MCGRRDSHTIVRVVTEEYVTRDYAYQVFKEWEIRRSESVQYFFICRLRNRYLFLSDLILFTWKTPYLL